jgi:methylphosphotriester-DNA--protein-cysteine methyltransferase
MIIKHNKITDAELRQKIRQKQICFGGNATLKIYGTLSCRSGKRLYKTNRVFFISQEEAIENNYRPCGHCMKKEYKQWISSIQKK